VREKQDQQVRQTEKLVLLVPQALQEKPERLEAQALLVRVGLLAKRARRAHLGTPEHPGKQVLLAQLEKVEKLVLQAALGPQVSPESLVQEKPEPQVPVAEQPVKPEPQVRKL
jgi:hypothetical protein